MNTSVYYVGLDLHKRLIAFCVKDALGVVLRSGTVSTERTALSTWASSLPRPWIGAMEATLFTGWVYDFLQPYATDLKVAHPEMLKAITAAKKKNDRDDAAKIADLLRTDLLPETYMASPEIRNLRRVLRYRNFLVRTSVRFQNKTAGLLMEMGVSYDKSRLKGKKYFQELLDNLDDIPSSVIEMLKLSRFGIDLYEDLQKRLKKGLVSNPLLLERVALLQTIPGVGEVLALSWALEIGDVHRFENVRQAVSYCGLCSAQHQSAGIEHRGPLSKKRNKHLQTELIEVAKLAPRWNPQLKAVHDREIQRGNANKATIAVARELVAFLMAVDKRRTPFISVATEEAVRSEEMQEQCKE